MEWEWEWKAGIGGGRVCVSNSRKIEMAYVIFAKFAVHLQPCLILFTLLKPIPSQQQHIISNKGREFESMVVILNFMPGIIINYIPVSILVPRLLLVIIPIPDTTMNLRTQFR